MAACLLVIRPKVCGPSHPYVGFPQTAVTKLEVQDYLECLCTLEKDGICGQSDLKEHNMYILSDFETKQQLIAEAKFIQVSKLLD